MWRKEVVEVKEGRYREIMRGVVGEIIVEVRKKEEQREIREKKKT